MVFDRTMIDADLSRLRRTGRFLSVQARVSEDSGAAGSVVVTFVLSERPLVTAVVLEGNASIGEKTLLPKIPVKVGEPLDMFSVREGRENILAAYQQRGYGRANVVVDEAAARKTGRVVYRIEEGPKVRVTEIRFEGAAAFEPSQLMEVIQTKTAVWIFRDGRFEADRAVADATAIQNFYRDHGYLDARASYRIDAGEEPGDLVLTFIIDEGVAYAVQEVRIEGNSILTAEEIHRMLRTKPGMRFDRVKLDDDVRDVRNAYGSRGYIYASVRPIRVFSTTPGFVVVTIRIDEGPRMTVGRVVVRGNEVTKDKVVRRALDLYPGELFDLTKITEAEKQLRQTRLFDRVKIKPAGRADDVRDIVMDVTETNRSVDLLFGFGVTSNSGLVGSVTLNYQNFDLFDPPRNFSEFIRFRSFRGGGQRLRLELEPGTQLNRFRLDFTEPYLGDKPVRFDFNLYHFTRGREGYDEQRSGSSVSFGTRLVDGVGAGQYLMGWYGEVAFRAEVVDLDDADVFDGRAILDARGDNLLTSVKLSVVRDRTDSRFIPTRGDRVSISYEQFVGDFNFGKVRARYARHHTIAVDAEERKSVFSFRIDSGLIVGTAPVFEAFYAGGIGSVRGFEFRGLGPHAGLEDAPIGGDFLLTTSLEYSFPLAGDVFRGVVFSDMGTVEPDFGLRDWRMAVGIGVRMTLELFGPVPIELDLALPISKNDDDDTRVFSFFIGGSF